MDQIGAVNVEELKKAGMSDADVEFIREAALMFKQKISEPGVVASSHEPESVIGIAYSSFQHGIALGIAKAKRLTKVRKTIGF